jgi:hypothetical protein
MQLENRVLIRQKIREITIEETKQVGGVHNTFPITPCTAPSPANPHRAGRLLIARCRGARPMGQAEK